mmetsp:Transcript_21442/g.42573  ORF Transcript_21442/g.42573 Transcript_21442/m.42573 type:complete len:100 (-) Transcript_21442:1660-1959(-)
MEQKSVRAIKESEHRIKTQEQQQRKRLSHPECQGKINFRAPMSEVSHLPENSTVILYLSFSAFSPFFFPLLSLPCLSKHGASLRPYPRKRTKALINSHL